MTTETHFADRLFDAAEEKQSHVVVGLDPRIELLPSDIVRRAVRSRGSSPPAAADAFIEFNSAIIDALADIAVAVKCQIAFYERYGLPGLTAYKQTVRLAKERKLIVIGDVKRNDIGSTAEAYARAHLTDLHHADAGAIPDAEDFHADAITVNPLFGTDGIAPFVERAARGGCGVFVLVRTSNPSSAELQELSCEGQPFHRHIAALVNRWGAPFVGKRGYSLVGAVAGATHPERLHELRSAMPATPLLIPGFGAQGGGADDAVGGFDNRGGGAVVSSSRAIIYAFREAPYAGRFGESNYKDAVRAAADDMRKTLWSRVHK